MHHEPRMTEDEPYDNMTMTAAARRCVGGLVLIGAPLWYVNDAVDT